MFINCVILANDIALVSNCVIDIQKKVVCLVNTLTYGGRALKHTIVHFLHSKPPLFINIFGRGVKLMMM